MSDSQIQATAKRRNLKELAVHEAGRFVIMFLYLWIMFVLFQIHQFVVLKQHAIPFEKWGFGFFNALVLAKVMMVADEVRVNSWLRTKPLIVAIVLRSIGFAILFIAVETLEELLVGLYHGKTLVESLPKFGGGGALGSALTGIIVSFALLPFFAFEELDRFLGRGKLRAMFLQSRNATNVTD